MKELYNQLQAATDPLETIEISDKILNERLHRYIMHLFLQGESLLSLAKFDEALECYDKALKINPNIYEVWENKAHALKNLKRYDEALE